MPAITKMKICTKCKEKKSLKNFYFRKDRNSYTSVCNNCVSNNTKEYYNNKILYHRNRAKISYNKNKERYLLKSYIRTDKENSLQCNLTVKYMKENITSKPCIYCGNTKDIGCDRIDNSKGHTIDNVIPCCKICNMTRGDRFSFDEMINFIGPSIKLTLENRNK